MKQCKRGWWTRLSWLCHIWHAHCHCNVLFPMPLSRMLQAKWSLWAMGQWQPENGHLGAVLFTTLWGFATPCRTWNNIKSSTNHTKSYENNLKSYEHRIKSYKHHISEWLWLRMWASIWLRMWAWIWLRMWALISLRTS